jgi:hypothetical protein
MMRCGTVRDWMVEFATDGVDPARQAEFAAHLAGCERCRAEWAAIGEAEAALELLTMPDPGDDFFRRLAGRIDAAVEAAPAPRTALGFGLWRQRVSALAGAGACVLIAVLALHHPGARPPVVAPPAPEAPPRVAALPPELPAPAAPSASAPAATPPAASSAPAPAATPAVEPTPPVARHAPRPHIASESSRLRAATQIAAAPRPAPRTETFAATAARGFGGPVAAAIGEPPVRRTDKAAGIEPIGGEAAPEVGQPRTFTYTVRAAEPPAATAGAGLRAVAAVQVCRRLDAAAPVAAKPTSSVGDAR